MLIKVKLFIEKSIYIFKKRFRYEMIKLRGWLPACWISSLRLALKSFLALIIRLLVS